MIIGPVIYAIINILNDRIYVGQTFNKLKRFGEHKKTLIAHTHCNPFLQKDWDKCGKNVFIFVELEKCELENLTIKEQYWIDKLKPDYNIAPVAGSMLNYKHTDEAKERMRQAQLGKKHSEETKKKMSEARKGNQVNKGRKQSKEVIEHRTKFVKGRKQSSEEIAKRVAARKGYVVSEETRLKMAAAKKGKCLSDEHKKKLSDAAKKQWERQLTNQNILNSDNWKSSWPD